MDKKTFILKNFFIKLIPSTHPAVYQYIKGGHKSKNSAVMRVTEEIYEWCNPYWMGEDSFTLEYIRGISRLYLAFMDNEFNEGRITPQEIYQNNYEPFVRESDM
jgi:hypothetical protein